MIWLIHRAKSCGNFADMCVVMFGLNGGGVRCLVGGVEGGKTCCDELVATQPDNELLKRLRSV